MALSFEDSLKAAQSVPAVASVSMSVPEISMEDVPATMEESSIMTLDYGIATADENDMIAAYAGTEYDSNYDSYSSLVDNKISTIDENKNIKLSNGQINITQESNSQFVPFKMPRYYDGFDLSATTLYIYWVNKEGAGSSVKPVNVSYDAENIYFAWLIDNNVTQLAGSIKFEIQAKGYIYDDRGTQHSYTWKSRPNSELNILQALEYKKVIEPSEDWKQDFFAEAQSYQTAAEAARDTALQYVEDVKMSLEEVQEGVQVVNQVVSNAVDTLEQEVDEKVSSSIDEKLADYPKKKDLPTKLSSFDNDTDFATKSDVNTIITNADLNKYATKTYVGDIPENIENVTNVVQYIDHKVGSVNVSERLKDYLLQTDAADTYATKAYVGDIPEDVQNVVEYIENQISSVDVSEQLKDYAKKTYVGEIPTNIEGVVDVVDYIDYKASSVDVSKQLAGYLSKDAAASTYLTQSAASEGYTSKATGNKLIEDIIAINTTLSNIDTSPRASYITTYNEPYMFEDTEYPGKDTLVLYEVYKDGDNEEVRKAVSSHVITGGSGGGTTNTLKIESDTKSNITFALGDKIEIDFTFIALDEDNNDLGQGIATWKIDSKTIINKEPIKTGKQTIDLTEYFKAGSDQKLTLIVTDDIGTIKQKNWYVSVIEMKLVVSTSDTTKNLAGQPVSFNYTPYGQIDKTIHFVLDGDYENEVTQSSLKGGHGYETSYSIPAQSHGAHLFEAYLTAVIDGETIESNHEIRDIIWYDANATEPVIGCASQKFTAKQYETTGITYTVYDPKFENPEVTLLSTYVNEKGETVEEYRSSLTMSSNTGHWQYRSDVVGTHTLTITCRGVTKTLIATIEETVFENVQPVTNSLAFDFNPIGYSNDSDRRLWSYDSVTENGPVSMTVSENFDWVNGGYQIDENGDSYFCIKAGTTATIDYKMFANTYNIKNTGGHYKLIFKTTRVQDASNPFLQCFKEGVGVVMQPQETNFYAGPGNHLYLAYSEDDVIEFELNMGEEIDSSNKMVMGYEDGVATKPLVYSDASFVQGITDNDAEYITLGSPSCDLHIYRFKAYRRALKSTEVLNNFILDTRDAGEMIKRYNRNQIYKPGEFGVLDPEYLAEKCKDLRIIMVSAPTFTTDKDTKIKDTTIQCIYKNGRAVEDNWIAYDCVHSGQGTSSNLYGAAGRNLDLIMRPYKNYGNTPYIVLDGGEGERVNRISLSKDSVPVDYLNVKVNIASSENANNALLAERYNRFNPYDRPLVREEGYPYDVKDTMEFQNCVVFIRETDETTDAEGNYINHVEFNDTNWHFYAIGNIGDSKKTDNTRVNDPDDVNEFILEVMDNNLPNSKFQSGVEDEKGYSITGSEIKKLWDTFKGKTYTSKEEMYSPVTESKYLVTENLPIFYELVDGDYVLTSDTEIASDKTYYEIIYPNAAFSGLYKDKYYRNSEGKIKLESGWGISFECRYEHKQGDHEKHREIWNKFYEFVIFSDDATFEKELGDYCVLKSVIFYYLFTLRYTMIDNRAKNCFWHYGKCEDGKYRFDLCFDYDNDTALGIDNLGKQVYRYGYEDIDYIDSKLEEEGAESRTWVFNAATSTFFKRLRDRFGADISLLYNELDSVEHAWSAEDLITQWDNFQSQFPEELWRQDIQRKYIRTFTHAFKNDPSKKDETFLTDKLNGRKKYHRRQFERSQEKYMASKFRAKSVANDIIRVRSKVPEGDLAVPANFDITVTPYAYMYVSVNYGGDDGYVDQQRAVPNVPVKLKKPSNEGDIIAIENASNLIAVGDLSSLYTEEATFSTATRLKELILGNSTPGYLNPNLADVKIASGGLLETLNIENLPALDDNLDFKLLTSLKTLKAKGSGIQGLTLAKNGAAEILSLPGSLGTLKMKSLRKLKEVDITSLDNLTGLIIEECDFTTVDNFVINGQSYPQQTITIKGKEYRTPNELVFIENAPNLRRVRLTGINWNLPDTSLLEYLYNLGGYDANEDESTSVLEGHVYVPNIKESEYRKYTDQENSKWKLSIDYTGWTSQHTVTFKNYKWNTDELEIIDGETQWVDESSYPIDPTKRSENKLTPTKADTVSQSFVFKGWSLDGKTIIDIEEHEIWGNTEYIAVYEPVTRKYPVKFVMGVGPEDPPLYETEAEYGSTVSYPFDVPAYTNLETSNLYYLFDHWSESGFVDGEKKIVAEFDEFKYSAGVFEGKQLDEMRPVEIYALAKKMAAGVLQADASGEKIIGTEINIADPFSFTMGYDVDYEDIETYTLIKDKTSFNGTQYIDFNGSTPVYKKNANGDFEPVYKEIKLFDNNRSFTLAIDYKLSSNLPVANQQDGTFVQCFDNDGSHGFTLDLKGATPTFTLGGAQTSFKTANANTREMIIIRHISGEKGVHVYISNLDGVAPEYIKIDRETLLQSSVATLVLGAAKSGNRYGNYCVGDVNWCKVWYTDLGDVACRKMASWPHEKISLEVGGFYRYRLYDNPNQDTSISLIATHLLDRKMQWNPTESNAGGWGKSSLQDFLNTRFYNAIPDTIKQLLKKMSVNSFIGEKSTTIGTSGCYVNIPCYRDVSPVGDSPYANELSFMSGTIPLFTTNNETRKRAFDNGAFNDYWLRTTNIATATSTMPVYVCYVDSEGKVQTVKSPNNKLGVLIELSL